jgi:hypothetical protein
MNSFKFSSLKGSPCTCRYQEDAIKSRWQRGSLELMSSKVPIRQLTSNFMKCQRVTICAKNFPHLDQFVASYYSFYLIILKY